MANKKCIPSSEHEATIPKKGNHRTASIGASISIDSSIDPCSDFYDFACGQGQNGPFFIDSEQVNMDLWNMIENGAYFAESREMELVKTFHGSCMNEIGIEAVGLNQFMKIIQNIGGWPLIEGERWNETAYDWVASIRRMRDIGLEPNYLFSTSVVTNYKNSSMRSLLVIFYLRFFSKHNI